MYLLNLSKNTQVSYCVKLSRRTGFACTVIKSTVAGIQLHRSLHKKYIARSLDMPMKYLIEVP